MTAKKPKKRKAAKKVERWWGVESQTGNLLSVCKTRFDAEDLLRYAKAIRRVWRVVRVEVRR